MRLLIPVILLAFPIAEIFVLVKLFHQYGWLVLVYLVVIGYLGLQLIRGEKILMGPKMMQSLASGGNPIRAMLGTARNMIAGVLLLIPGVITDIIAAVLLLLPVKGSGQQNAQSADFSAGQSSTTRENTAPQDGDVIEGEYTHVQDKQNKLK